MPTPKPNEEPYAAIGSRWLAFRSDAGLTQAALSRKAGVTVRTISDIEAGRRRPSAATFRKLAEALGLSSSRIAELLGGVPHQLPKAPARFTARSKELAVLSAGRPVRIVTGPGGIGKTWLALHWAHANLGEFPDGRLYVDLRGYEPGQAPVTTAEALRQLLSALGVDGAAMPLDLDARSSLLRDLLSRKQMLLILDDARDCHQVLPLLPGNGGCCVTIVTSRDELKELDAERQVGRVRLPALPEADALDLFGLWLDEARLTAEPHAVRRLAAVCAGLPLAVNLVAARAALHPEFTLAALAAELDELESRLDALTTGDLSTSLRSVFAVSFARLNPAAARIAALLGLVPSPSISLPALSGLSALPGPDLARALSELETAHLIERHEDDRITMHDLIHLYASEPAAGTLTEAERTAAKLRFVDHYLHTGLSADRCLAPRYQWRDFAAPTAGSRPAAILDQAAALDWFGAEHAGILDAQSIAAHQDWDDKVWQLAWILRTVHRWQVRLDDDLTMWTNGLRSADRTGDATAIAIAEFHMGAAMMNLERRPAAERHLSRGLDHARRAGELQVQCGIHYVRSLIAQHRGDWEACLHHSREVLAAAIALGEPARVAEARNGLGWSLAHLDRYAEARTECREAVAILEGTDHAEAAFGQPSTFLDSTMGAGVWTEALRELDYTIDDAGLWTELVQEFNDLIARSTRRLEAAQSALHTLATAYELQDGDGARAQSDAQREYR